MDVIHVGWGQQTPCLKEDTPVREETHECSDNAVRETVILVTDTSKQLTCYQGSKTKALKTDRSSSCLMKGLGSFRNSSLKKEL